MRPALVWLTALVLSAAVGVGIVTFSVYAAAGLMPVLALVAASRARVVGIAGLLWGIGGIWFLAIQGAQAACSGSTSAYGQTGCGSPVEQTYLLASEVMLAVGTGLMFYAIWLRRRR